jgi:hypothetical protein
LSDIFGTVILRSEQTLGLDQGKKPKVKFAGEDGEEELDSDDEEFPDYLVDEMDPDAMRQYRAGGSGRKQQHNHDDDEEDDEDYDYQDEDSDAGRFVAGGAKNAAVGPLSAEAREALELQFERTMQEYEDNEIGYLSDVSGVFYFVLFILCLPL